MAPHHHPRNKWAARRSRPRRACNCPRTPVWKSTSENLVSLHAIEQMQLRRKYRVDGVGRPKFYFHTGVRRQLHALRGGLRRTAHL